MTTPDRQTDWVMVPATVSDEWAEAYCALVNRNPDGAECKVVEGIWHETTFRDLAKGEIAAMIAAAPSPAKVVGREEVARALYESRCIDSPPVRPWATMAEHDRDYHREQADKFNAIMALFAPVVGQDFSSRPQGGVPTATAEAAVVGWDGYSDAFYEVADMLGLSAMPISPREVWRTYMRPLLKQRLAGPVWRPMSEAPRHKVIIAMARYRDATAGAPAFVAFMDGEWREMGRTLMEPMVCWAWMPREALGGWPSEADEPAVVADGGRDE